MKPVETLPGTPAEQGYRMPAEWARHEATWIGWPHNRYDWPGKLNVVQWAFAEMVRALSGGETVRILVQDARRQERARSLLLRAGVEPSRVEFHQIPTDRSWTRDYGPILVRHAEGRRAIVDFDFTAWAKYPNWRRDDAVATEAAARLSLPVFVPEVGGRRFVLEGGAIDVNGQGTVLTTEECLLHPRRQRRNPGMRREQVEQALRDWLGATNVLWLGRGIAGDDTHGHVDDFCRFVNPRTVVLAEEKDAGDPNHAILEENRERLEQMRLEDGGRVEVIRLPMPSRLQGYDRRLPASYANFYIANDVIMVPTFNDAKDRAALGILADLFPGRSTVGIHAVDLVWGLGGVHCLTQQHPE